MGAEHRAHRVRRRAARWALAPVRGLVLWLVDAAGWPLLALTLAAAQATYLLGVPYAHVAVVEAGRRLTGLARRLAERWSGVPVPVPYAPRPAPPAPDADGLYRHGRRFYATSRIPMHQRLVRWIVQDEATWRDLVWQLLAPVVWGPAALAPAVLLVGGPALAASGRLPAAVGAVSALVGLAAGPALLGVHARGVRLLLAPVERSRCGAALRALLHAGVALQRLTRLVAVAVAELAVVLLLLVAYVPLRLTEYSVLWWGLVVSPARQLVEYSRQLVREREGGAALPSPYLPEPAPPRPRADGLYRWGNRLYPGGRRPAWYQRRAWLLEDPATRRDGLWLVADPLLVLGAVLPLVAPALLGVFGLLWPWLWWPLAGPLLHYDPQGPWHRLAGALSALLGVDVPRGPAAGLGAAVVLIAVSALLAGPLLRLHTRWARLLLAPTGQAQLRRRVAELIETRTVATRAQAAELRRIERDLHDGSQARLLAIGLKLNQVKGLIDTDPEGAKRAVAQAQQAAAQALAELRDLVRGIHPPVLAERGLGDAVRALAMDSPLEVSVELELPAGGLEQPLETAVYMAVSELLTNALKHAGAARVQVAVVARAGLLSVAVRDDGRGGADPAAGGGLQGIARRLTPFDGTLRVDSPPGGPTEVALELPLPAEAGS